MRQKGKHTHVGYGLPPTFFPAAACSLIWWPSFIRLVPDGLIHIEIVSFTSLIGHSPRPEAHTQGTYTASALPPPS